MGRTRQGREMMGKARATTRGRGDEKCKVRGGVYWGARDAEPGAFFFLIFKTILTFTYLQLGNYHHQNMTKPPTTKPPTGMRLES